MWRGKKNAYEEMFYKTLKTSPERNPLIFSFSQPYTKTMKNVCGGARWVLGRLGSTTKSQRNPYYFVVFLFLFHSSQFYVTCFSRFVSFSFL